MGKRKCAAVLLACCFFSVIPPRHAEALNLTKAFQFSGGVVTAIFLHEVGHWLTGRLAGGETEITSLVTTKMTLHPPRNESMQWFALGGYLMQTLVSEVILSKPEWHENDFALGMLTFGFANNLSNTVQYALFNTTDLAAYQAWGGNAPVAASLLTLESLNGFRRIAQDTQIFSHLSKTFLEDK